MRLFFRLMTFAGVSLGTGFLFGGGAFVLSAVGIITFPITVPVACVIGLGAAACVTIGLGTHAISSSCDDRENNRTIHEQERRLDNLNETVEVNSKRLVNNSENLRNLQERNRKLEAQGKAQQEENQKSQEAINKLNEEIENLRQEKYDQDEEKEFPDYKGPRPGSGAG